MIRKMLLAVVAAAACVVATESNNADAQVRVYRGPNRTFVGVGGARYYRRGYGGYGYGAYPYYGGGGYYSSPYYSNYGYAYPSYGYGYGYPSYGNYYGGRRGAYFGRNGFVIGGPRGRLGVRY